MTDDVELQLGCNPLGCAACLCGVFVLCWAWWFGLPLPGGVLDLDVFPPAVRWSARP